MDFVGSDYYYGPFRQGMRELGYVEGKNEVIEWPSAERNFGASSRSCNRVGKSQSGRYVVTTNTPTTSGAQKATTAIPIVMGSGGDPVGAGSTPAPNSPHN